MLIVVFLVRSSFAFVFLKCVSDHRDLSFTIFEIKRLYNLRNIGILVELELIVYSIS
jgi:hypothetical protein